MKDVGTQYNFTAKYRHSTFSYQSTDLRMANGNKRTMSNYTFAGRSATVSSSILPVWHPIL